MRRPLMWLSLLFLLGFGSACQPYHARVPGVIDLRPEANSGTPAGNVHTETIRLWLFLAIPLNDTDVAGQLTAGETTGINNVQWDSRFSLWDLLINFGATALIGGVGASQGAVLPVPTSVIISSRTLRVDGTVVELPTVAGTQTDEDVEVEVDADGDNP